VSRSPLRDTDSSEGLPTGKIAAAVRLAPACPRLYILQCSGTVRNAENSMTQLASRFRSLTLIVVAGLCSVCAMCCKIRAEEEASRGGAEETKEILRENLEAGSRYKWLLGDQKHNVYLWRTTDAVGIAFFEYFHSAKLLSRKFERTKLSLPTSVIRDLIVHSAQNGNRARVYSGLSMSTGDAYRGWEDFIDLIVVKDGAVASDLVKEITGRYKVALPYTMRLVLRGDGNLYVDLHSWTEVEENRPNKGMDQSGR